MTEQLVRRDFPVAIEKYDPQTRTVSGIISSASLDRWGDVLDQNGIEISRSVPPLWAHDSRQPIGRSVGFRRDGDRTHASFKLASPGVDETADRIHSLVKDGVITNFSVGLLPKKWEGNVVKQSELVEVSIVALAANQDAEILAIREPPPPQHQEIVMDRSGVVRIGGNSRVAAPSIITRNAAQDRWSLARFLAMVLEDRDGPDYGFEAEIHQEIVQRNGAPRHGGFMLPMRGLLERAIGAVPPTDAGAPLTQTEYLGQLFGLDSDAVTPLTVCGRLGARVVVATQSTVSIPRQDTALGAMQWIARDGSATEQSDAGFRSIELTPCTGVALHMVKRSARLYTTPGVEDLYRQQMAEKISYGLDVATLYGSGTSNVPAGLITQADLQKPTMTALDYPSLAAMAASILTLPAPPANRAWLFNGALGLALMSTHKFGASAKSDETIIEEGQTDLLGVPFVTGSQVPVNATTGATDIWIGDWAMVVQVWFNSGAIEILPNPYEGVAYKQGAIWLESFVDFNTAVLDAKRLAVAQNVVSPIKPAALGTSTTRAPKVAEQPGSGRK